MRLFKLLRITSEQSCRVFAVDNARALEHGTISPDFDLVVEFMRRFGKDWEDELWKYCWSELKGVGVLGAMMIRHARRADKVRKDLFFSVHYHFLALMVGGSFDVCRNCPTRDKRVGISPECRTCGAFMGRVLRANDGGNGCVVKVFDKRKTVEGTINYVMSHCSLRVDVRRDHAVRWFGVLATRVLRSKPLDKKVRCVVCNKEVRRDLKYVGRLRIVKNAWEPDFKSFLLVEPVDGVTGLDNFVDITFRDEGGGLNG